jgi:VWFA-related protein
VTPARAAVTLRITPGTSPDPIQVFVTVTDTAGAPVSTLLSTDFRLALDGTELTSGISFTKPPGQDPNQRTSVVFAMDYSGSVQAAALSEMQNAVIDFINAMVDGDVAAVVKFNGSTIAVDAPFTVINSAAKTTLAGQVMAPFNPGSGTNLIDGLNSALNQFITPPAGVTLPNGPKAIIAITDGRDNSSTTAEGAVVDGARANGIPLFTIGVTGTRNTALLNRLPTLTGGEYIDTANSAQIAAAYTRIADRLKNEYLLAVSSTITDCNSHEIQVRVQNDPAKTGISTFQRCTSSSPPPPPPPGGGGGSGGGGGGGGALGLALLPGLLALVIARRRWTWTVRG